MCQTLHSLLVLGTLSLQPEYRKLDAVAPAMIYTLSYTHVKPDEQVLVQGYGDTSMPPLESRDGLVLSSLLYHEDVTGLENYK